MGSSTCLQSKSQAEKQGSLQGFPLTTNPAHPTQGIVAEVWTMFWACFFKTSTGLVVRNAFSSVFSMPWRRHLGYSTWLLETNHGHVRWWRSPWVLVDGSLCARLCVLWFSTLIHGWVGAVVIRILQMAKMRCTAIKYLSKFIQPILLAQLGYKWRQDLNLALSDSWALAVNHSIMLYKLFH